MTILNKGQLKNEIYKLSRYQVANGNPILKLLYPTVETVELDSVISILDNVEKPVIPQFVADWIGKAKRYHSISWLLNYENIKGWSHELTLWCFESGNDDNLHKLARAWLDGYTVEEEQKYYALIKGHENIDSDDKYWNYCVTDENLDVGDNKVHPDVIAEYILKTTKEEWADLGINNDNADFVNAEELEE